jgi:hypothetical protein
VRITNAFAHSIPCLAHAHRCTVTLESHPVSTKRQCSDRIEDFDRITPAFDRRSDRFIEEETRPAKCAA